MIATCGRAWRATGTENAADALGHLCFGRAVSAGRRARRGLRRAARRATRGLRHLYALERVLRRRTDRRRVRRRRLPQYWPNRNPDDLGIKRDLRQHPVDQLPATEFIEHEYTELQCIRRL